MKSDDREPADQPRAQSEDVELLGPDALLSQVTKAVLERALGEEMSEHLGYEKHDPAGRGSGNSRNGSTGKRLLTEIGGIELEIQPTATVRSAADRVQGPDRLARFNGTAARCADRAF
ncbi:MAG: hypothetical protein JWO57_2500 [Pseudonocardiales bacterium]|nr:hypothetical protein [Pseudonocardiales bacterium]